MFACVPSNKIGVAMTDKFGKSQLRNYKKIVLITVTRTHVF